MRRPLTKGCPDTQANGTRGIDGNHRFVIDASLLTPLLVLGWKSEGVVFCAPPAGHE